MRAIFVYDYRILVQESPLSTSILQPGLQLLQCLEAMGNLVFFFLVHLCVPTEVSKKFTSPLNP
jgi:hypothetical protein